MKLPVVGNVSILAGIAIGVGALLLAPVVIPMIGAVIRPVAKGAIKAGLIVYHKGEVIAAEAKETWEDLTAEVKAEMAQEAAVPAVVEGPKPAKSKTV